MYYKSVGRNSTLIIGLTPDPNGLLPAPDVKRLKEWGDEMKRRFLNPIATISGKGNKIVLKLNKKTLVDHVIIQEDIQFGERVRAYQLEGFINGKWIVLSEGKSIGHKRIERFKESNLSKLRLVITSSTRQPIIKNISTYYIN